MEDKILIDVQINAERAGEELRSVISSVADLKKENAALKKEIEAGRDATGELSAAYAKNAQTIQNLQARQKALTGEIQTTNTTADMLGDSFVELNQQAKNLEAQYKALTKAQRESAEGQAMKKQLQELKEQLKDFDAELGNHQRNVGNYPQTVTALIPGFDRLIGTIDKLTKVTATTPSAFAGMAQGIGSATKAALKFIATPIGAVIAAVAVAVKAAMVVWDKLTEAIAKNDDAGTALARLYEVTVQPVVDMVTKAFARLADWIGKAAAVMADWIGGSEQAADATNSLVIATDELEEAERQYVQNSAKRLAEVAQLRDKAAQKDKYTAEQRRQYLQQAIDLERQNLEDEKNIKAERLRILEATAAREQDTSDETKNKIAQARADMSRAEEAYYTGTRRLNSQLQSLNAEIAADAEKQAKAAADKRAAENAEREKQTKEREETERRQAAVLAEIRRKAKDLAVQMIGEEGVRAVAARKLAGEREIAAMRQQLERGEDLTAQAREELAALIKAKEQSLQNDLQRMADDYAAKQIAEQAAKTRQSERTLIELRKQVAKEGSEELLRLQLQAMDLQKEEELTKYKEGSEERLLIDRQYEAAKAELEQSYRQAKEQAEIEMAQKVLSMVTDLNGSIAKIEKAELKRFTKEQDEKKEALKKQLDSGILSEEEYAARTAEIDEETRQREIELEREQAKREKALNIFSATLSTLAAIIGFLANPGGIPGIALSALAALTGAAQVAAIAAEPLPEFATGGMVGGTSYTGDKVLARVNSGEGILTAQGVDNLTDTVQAIDRGAFGTDPELLAAAVAATPPPVMVYSEYKQFNQRRATYAELTRV